MAKVKNKLALGIATVQKYADAEQRIDRICPGGHASGHYRKGNLHLGPEFKGISNHDYNINGAIRTSVDARALDLQHGSSNRGADVMSQNLYRRLSKLKIKPTALTLGDYKKHGCHCEHINTIKDKADKIRSIQNVSGPHGRKSIIQILEENTAVATITMAEKLLLDDSKHGWARYANLPVVYTQTGQLIKSQKDLETCRAADLNNSIAEKFQSLSTLSPEEWLEYEKMAVEKIYRGEKDAKWTRLPDLNDPNNIAIIKRNNPIEITKAFWPDHLKSRFLKDKTQKQAVAKKYKFIWDR
jgi:hypothetical protein